jgi:hypothetical protein
MTKSRQKASNHEQKADMQKADMQKSRSRPEIIDQNHI